MVSLICLQWVLPATKSASTDVSSDSQTDKSSDSTTDLPTEEKEETPTPTPAPAETPEKKEEDSVITAGPLRGLPAGGGPGAPSPPSARL